MIKLVHGASGMTHLNLNCNLTLKNFLKKILKS